MSAHEPGETTDSQLNSGAGTNNGALGNKLESIKGAVDALAAAVAAAAAVVRSSGKNCLHAAAKPVYNIFNFFFDNNLRDLGKEICYWYFIWRNIL